MKIIPQADILLRLTSLVICAALIMTATTACSVQTDASNGSDAYDYPVKPGTDVWKALGSHTDMVKACQIPGKRLHTMSTMGLLETVLNYPLFGDALAYNSPQQGFDSLSSQFNGISELVDRADAGTMLLAKYKAMDPVAFGQDWTDLQKGEYAFKFMDIDMLLAQRVIIGSLNTMQCQDLVSECLTKIDAKRQSEMYGHMSQDICLWVIARVLERAKYTPFLNAIAADSYYQGFVDKGSFATDTIVSDIFAQAQRYLGISMVNDTWPAQESRYLSCEEWIDEHKDSTDLTDIALIKYYQAIQVSRSTHPEYGVRSDWGVDYTGELNILKDLGVAGLPGLLNEVQVTGPFVIPVIVTINEICKTDFGYIGHFSAEEITLWKLAFNNKLGTANDIVANVVQTLKSNSFPNEVEINTQLSKAGIFALPYFYDEVINKANYNLKAYASLVLPYATMKKFDLQSSNNEQNKIISTLKSCQEEIKMIKSLTVN